MVNKIHQIYSNLNDDELFQCLEEIDVLENTGILYDGKCRQLEEQYMACAWTPSRSLVVDVNVRLIYREAAKRWKRSIIFTNKES